MTIRDYLKRCRNKAVLFVLPGIAFYFRCLKADIGARGRSVVVGEVE
jgi:hypothetical protein